MTVSTARGAVPAARSRHSAGRLARSARGEVARVEAHVERREVEAEQLDDPREARDPALREPPPAVLRKAACDRRQVGQQLLARPVAVVSEPPPHERELAAVRLAQVLRPDRGGVLGELALVPLDRPLELVGDGDQRSRRRQLRRERPDLRAVQLDRGRARAVERRSDRLGPGVGIPVHVAADPRPERERRRRIRKEVSPVAEQLLRGLHEAVAEEPQPVVDLVGDTRLPLAHLVGLPQEGHLLCELGPARRRGPSPTATPRRAGRGAPRSARARAASSAAWPPSGVR